jgi:serine/threonine protein kinase/ribosomal protein L40E
MTMAQTTTEHSLSGNLHCPRCDALLPLHATFCGSCGERVGKEKKGPPPAQDAVDTPSRYQVTSLVRQRPYVKLFFALDNQQQRMVVMRNIDISSLDEEAQAKASEVVQCEYDLLRQEHITSIMPVIDVQNSLGHLLTITSQPIKAGNRKGSSNDVSEEGQKVTERGLRTLQDFLQSRKDVPEQQFALAWIGRLCQALEGLHQHQIVIGDLDPYAILLDGDDEYCQPLLTVSWLPPQLRPLFPRPAVGQDEQSGDNEEGENKDYQGGGMNGSKVTSPLATSFIAPEVLLGRVEPTADVYSLGAILYFLLTGAPPDRLMERTQQRLHSPDELNSHVSRSVADIVMKALSLEPSERFQSVKELAEALSSPHDSTAYAPGSLQGEDLKEASLHHITMSYASRRDQLADMDTINMMPLLPSKNEPRLLWEIPTSDLSSTINRDTYFPGRLPTFPMSPAADQPLSTEKPILVEGTLETQPTEIDLPTKGELGSPSIYDTSDRNDEAQAGTSLVQQFTQQISGMLPAIPRLSKRVTGMQSSAQHSVQPQEEQQDPAWLLPRLSQPHSTTIDGSNAADETLLKHIRRLLIGERKQTTTAATIENPLRIQPEHGFNIRIRLMGRDEPDAGSSPRGHVADASRAHSRLYGTIEGIPSSGLGAHVHGDLVYVEVRSAIHENYAYIVQQAAVKIPAQGYVAEIVIPMQPFSRKSNGRRERLHVFFFDEMRRPLYERPFVLEILVSYLVQPGREGHHVLPIPQ